MVKKHIFYEQTTDEFQINVIDEGRFGCVCCCHEEYCKFTTNPNPSPAVVTKKLSNPKRESIRELVMQEIVKAITLYVANLYHANN